MKLEENRLHLFEKEGSIRVPPAVHVILLVLLFLPACAGREGHRGSLEWENQPFYFHDLPRFQLQVFPHSGSESGIDVFFSFSTESLVFLADSTGFISSILIEIHLLDRLTEALVAETSWKEMVREESYDATRSRKERSFQRRMAAGPGSYLVRVLVTDDYSDKTSVRQRTVEIHGAVDNSPLPGEINIRLTDGNVTGDPFLGLTLGGPSRDLSCSVEIYNTNEIDSLIMDLLLVKFRSDTTLPSLPFAFSATRGSLEHNGINPADSDTMYRSERRVVGNGNDIVISWRLSLPHEGIYLLRGEGFSYSSGGGIPFVLEPTQRPIALFSPGFPTPTQIDDLIEPLVYVAREEEMDSLTSLSGTGDKRFAFERFWLKLAGDKIKASTMIRQYYTRVEEANIHFSSFNEGWKTDRGMIYIVFGPPVSVQSGIDGELWSYGAVDGDRLNSYYFRRVLLPPGFDMFDHFVLDRQAYYDQPWISAVERWRRGAGF